MNAEFDIPLLASQEIDRSYLLSDLMNRAFIEQDSQELQWLQDQIVMILGYPREATICYREDTQTKQKFPDVFGAKPFCDMVDPRLQDIAGQLREYLELENSKYSRSL